MKKRLVLVRGEGQGGTEKGESSYKRAAQEVLVVMRLFIIFTEVLVLHKHIHVTKFYRPKYTYK